MTATKNRLNVLSWNINSLRTSKSQLKEILTTFACDILCLQETKLTRDQLDEETAILDGFNSYYCFSRTKAGYSGVATICKSSFTPVAAEEGLTGILQPSNTPESEIVGEYGELTDFTREELKAIDSEGRVLITKHKIRGHDDSEEFVTFINVYCPRAECDNLERQNFKLKFYKILQQRAEAILESGSHVVILGDINTSHKPIDICGPTDVECFSSNKGRQWLDNFIIELNRDADNPLENGDRFVDSFRYFHSTQTDAFTCWNTSTGARQTNFGSRIDYIIANATFVRKAFVSSEILSQVEGSDHCPISAQLECEPISSERCPFLCTKYWPEVSGKQQKLLSFFHKPGKSSPNESALPKKRTMEQNRTSKKVKRVEQKSLANYFLSNKKQFSSKLTEPSVQERKHENIFAVSSDKTNSASAEWKAVLTGPKPPPCCSGHNEPCVLRTVKKSGPNQGRQFYTCSRPEGLASNPKSRCNYFVWKNER